MAWFRLDDNGWCHPKVLAAGNRAFGAWCRAGQWSSQQLADGFVAASVCRLIEPATAVWQALEVAGLLHRCEGGYMIHDYLAYNPSKEQIEAKRSAQREGGKAGARTRWNGLEHGSTHGSSHRSTHGATQHDQNGPIPTHPDPSHPVENICGVAPLAPAKTQPVKDGSTKPAPRRPLPANWAPNDKHRTLAAARGVSIDAEAEKMRDWATSNAEKKSDWDATFRNWLRNAKASIRTVQREDKWQRTANPERERLLFTPNEDGKF